MDKWLVGDPLSRAGRGRTGRGWDGMGAPPRLPTILWMFLMREGAPARWLAPALSLSLWPRPCLSLAAHYQGAFWEVVAARFSTEREPFSLRPPPNTRPSVPFIILRLHALLKIDNSPYLMMAAFSGWALE